MKEIYLKVKHKDGDIGLVSVNSEAVDKLKDIYIKQGAKCTEVSKDEFVKLAYELETLGGYNL